MNYCSKTSMRLNLFSNLKIPKIVCNKIQLPAPHNLRSLNVWVIFKDYRILEPDKTLKITFIWLIDFKLESSQFQNSKIPLWVLQWKASQ